jgi:hypothetical protein
LETKSKALDLANFDEKRQKSQKMAIFTKTGENPGFWPKWPNPGFGKKVSVPGRAFFPLLTPAVSKY